MPVIPDPTPGQIGFAGVFDPLIFDPDIFDVGPLPLPDLWLGVGGGIFDPAIFDFAVFDAGPIDTLTLTGSAIPGGLTLTEE